MIVTCELTDQDGQAHPLRVGFAGFAPPQTAVWEGAKLANHLQGRDVLEAAMAHVPRLRAQGADVVVALSHSGIGATIAAPWMENASAALAGLDGIDALVTGHTHQTFPVSGKAACGHLSGKPAVMPGFYGSHLGVIDLDLIWVAGRWQVQDGQSALRPISRRSAGGALRSVAANAPGIVQASAPSHQATRAWANRPVGSSAHALHSFFAMIAPSSTLRLIARASGACCAGLSGGPYAHLPVLSAAAPFHAGRRGGPDNFVDIPAGPLTLRHVFDLYPHPNAVAALLVRGAELRLWLERSFSQFPQIAPQAQDAPLLDPDFPSLNFDTIEGLTWAVDLSAPPWIDAKGAIPHPLRCILNLSYQGQPLAPDQPFVLATNSYRASGSGGFVGPETKALPLGPPRGSREVLATYIDQTAPVAAEAPLHWHFMPMPNTTVVFDTAPRAESHVPSLTPLRATPLSITPHGFRRFRLHL